MNELYLYLIISYLMGLGTLITSCEIMIENKGFSGFILIAVIVIFLFSPITVPLRLGAKLAKL